MLVCYAAAHLLNWAFTVIKQPVPSGLAFARTLTTCGIILSKAPLGSQHSLHAGNNGLHAKPEKRSAAIEALAVWQNRAAVTREAGSVKQNV